MRLVERIVAAGFAVLVIFSPAKSILNLSGSSSYSATIKAAKPARVAEGTSMDYPAYRRTEKEKQILRFLMRDDFIAYSEGRKHSSNAAKFDRENQPIFVTADALQFDYERNEVAADKKYRHKNLFASGVILSINRGIGEHYYLILAGGTNMFTNPHAGMTSGLEDYLAALQKGQKIDLSCKGAGLLMGSAMLEECIPTIVWAERKSDQLIKQIDANIRAGDKGALSISVFATALYSLLPGTSSCYSSSSANDKQCSSELERLDSNQLNKALLESAKKYGKDAVFMLQALENKGMDSQQEPVEK